MTLGVPLLTVLEPQERVALVAHELSHGRNGDATRGLFVGSAVLGLAELYGSVAPDDSTGGREWELGLVGSICCSGITSAPSTWPMPSPPRWPGLPRPSRWTRSCCSRRHSGRQRSTRRVVKPIILESCGRLSEPSPSVSASGVGAARASKPALARALVDEYRDSLFYG